ncbi:hypothetical protein Y032_0227g2837 [Ancylostoma ceylanicum]|uniref:Uncharacterized protein n=1 Tax=Ancylostoma ceylanicum TaxID=53326 RepID=A0A016SHL0_9BILA|nr:hypothetical protein Y032_0227g2837 [Ancylostoma ceylanicum]
MSHVLVFYTRTRTTDVLALSAIPDGVGCGDTTRVLCSGRRYKAKILFIGSRDMCESKSSLVTTDGQLVEEELSFEITSSGSDMSEDEDETPPTPPADRELITRLIKLDELLSVQREEVTTIKNNVATMFQKIDRIGQEMRELLRRVPATRAQAGLVYTYATPETVSYIREMKGPSMSHFALALEKEVYKDETTELDIPIDYRVRTKDRVTFIQQCLYKYYDVPEHMRESAWKRVKLSLNGRVRRLRKHIRDSREQRVHGSEENLNDDYEEYNFD